MVDEKELEARVANYIADLPESSTAGQDPDELWGYVYEQILAEMEYEEQKPQIDADIARAKEERGDNT